MGCEASNPEMARSIPRRRREGSGNVAWDLPCPVEPLLPRTEPFQGVGEGFAHLRIDELSEEMCSLRAAPWLKKAEHSEENSCR